LPPCQSLMQIANSVKVHQFTQPDLRAAVQTAVTVAKTAHMKALKASRIAAPVVANPDGGAPPPAKNPIAVEDQTVLIGLLQELTDDISSFNSTLTTEDTNLDKLINNLGQDIATLQHKHDVCTQAVTDATNDKNDNDQTITDQSLALSSNQTLSSQLDDDITTYLSDVAEITEEYNVEFEHREEELRLIACIRKIICDYYLDSCYDNYEYGYDYSYGGSESWSSSGGEWVWVPFAKKHGKSHTL